MDVTSIIDPLNDAQRQAVTAPTGAMLVLAGAGSGKTRVLVHRIAWVIKVEGVSPHALLAVTFTNKAAMEMRQRVESMLQMSATGLWIGTFHGIAHRLLRRHAKDVGLPDTFQILDSDDQYRLIRRLLTSLNLDEARWPPRQAQWFINAQKDEGRRAKHMVDTGDPFAQQMLKIYIAYEEICQRSGLVDFAELLLRAHELLRDHEGVLEHYQERFRYVLVDEFQDTNTIQYAWLRLLTTDRDNLFVVGDDDQSIYGWRGAKIENLQRFQKDNPTHQLVRLEQNYRSTGTILSAANALIANNEGRLGKKLWTDGNEGDPILVYSAFNELDEALFVIDRIKQWIDANNARKDSAILYRSNAQSRVFEEKLVASGIPYRVYGGLRFFDRAEIKNALAYLRLIANRDDDPSFERVVNLPTRGIGTRTVDAIRETARAGKMSLWLAAVALCDGQALSARAGNAVKNFLALVDSLDRDVDNRDLPDKTRIAIERSGLLQHYEKDNSPQAEDRVENLEELVNATRHYTHEDEAEEGLSELDAFLAHAALEAGEAQGDQYEDCVQLMTLHSAKGLEFPLVFMVGLEEGLFPSQQSLEDAGRLEEERRLCYVGVTRAMQQLYMTFAESRRLYGRETFPRYSRFLREIPADKLQEVRIRASVNRPLTASSQGGLSPAVETNGLNGYKLGQRVRHAKFGDGIVLQSEGDGSQARVQVNFEQAGTKWLMLAYAKLQQI